MRKISTNPATHENIAELQSQLLRVRGEAYHEYYRITTEHGFMKVTVPKQRDNAGAKQAKLALIS